MSSHPVGSESSQPSFPPLSDASNCAHINRSPPEHNTQRSHCSEGNSSNTRDYSLSSLNLGRVVGTGAYSDVRIAQDRRSGTVLAVKRMSKANIVARKAVRRVRDEREILSKLNSKWVTAYEGAFQDHTNLYLLTEFVPGGELYSVLARKGPLSKAEVRFYSAEIVTALCYLHSEGVLYRDLKPENVLITSSGHIKLADFSCAKWMKQGEKTYSLVGTPHCLAPEMIQRSGHSFAVDWWTLGVLIYEMMFGESPFAAATPYETYAKIIANQPELPKDMDAAARDLISGLLQKAPERRYGKEEVRTHSFFQDLHWSQLEDNQPPMVPFLKNALDTRHFQEFEETSQTTTPVPDTLFIGF